MRKREEISKYNTKGSYQITRKENKRRKNKQTNTTR